MTTLSVRHVTAVFITVALFSGAMAAAQDKKPPEKLVFPTKSGNVIFTHSAHIDRAKGKCSTCHDKLWPQSVKEPLKSSDGCATCHRLFGKAFRMKGNCVKCHPGAGTNATVK
jgi:c(7)-type cytochrome triheme protein